ncbi:DUF393 domain-containing protein [Parasalinivibrio latis]|uniref:thiol-disulfide oxidoreductase DCC family protein n=1 Tax=Parasalinivibrio latis TaxID=2952610 RepID=UPI0030E3F8C4
MQLILFYDGTCPLCVAEMGELAQLDAGKRLTLVDIHTKDFARQYPDINKESASTILHGYVTEDDKSMRLLLGLDVTCTAWNLVGKKRWLKMLRWPVVRWFADWAYMRFANNRYFISYLLTGKSRCQNGNCRID